MTGSDILVWKAVIPTNCIVLSKGYVSAARISDVLYYLPSKRAEDRLNHQKYEKPS